MIRKALRLSKEEYLNWITNPKILLILFFIVFSIENTVSPMYKLAIQNGYKLNLTEPFILLTSKGLNVIILPLVFVMLISDFPSNKSSNIFAIFRTSRLSWLLGQIVFILNVYITYIVCIWLSVSLYISKNSFFSNDWSEYTLTFYQQYPNLYTEHIFSFIGAEIYSQMSPLEALLNTFLLMLCHTLVICLFLILFKLINLKSLGVFFTVALISVTGVSGGIKISRALWIFPMTHSVLGWHFDEFMFQPNFSLQITYIYYVIMIVVLLLTDILLVKYIKIGDEC